MDGGRSQLKHKQPLFFIFSIILILTSIIIFMTSIHAQPTWSFRIKVLPAELYMGEWNRIYVNITNIDCNDRGYYVLEFKSTSERYMEGLVTRAEEMKSKGLIENYTLKAENMWGRGGEVYADYTLYLEGVCMGRSIEVVRTGVWFPFKGIARAMTFWNNTSFTLEAFKPVRYIINGSHPESTKLLQFKVYVPEDIPSEEISTRPAIDIRVRFPGWLEYTLESYRIDVNEAVIQPYRSFNLTITDFDGLNPIPNARVVIRRLMYYYESREYVTPENGTVRIVRLYDDKYEVAVYWNSTLYRQEYPHIYYEQHWAQEIASSKKLKTGLFNLKIKTLDVKGAPLDGAKVIFDGVERNAYNGEASFSLVPQGNHTAEIYWRGVKVFDGWLWVGYHPTIYPWMTRPAVLHELKLPVADLLVEAVDTGGNRMPANFTVIGPTPEASITNIYSRSGLLNVSQLPIAEYHVKASSKIQVFNKTVYSEGVYKPGEVSKLVMPVHSLFLTVRNSNGEPLSGAEVRLGPVEKASGEDGSLVFPGVPEGEYELEVRWLGVLVYSKRVKLSEPARAELDVKVYDVSVTFLDKEGGKVYADYLFRDPAGREFKGEFEDGFRVEGVPEGLCSIVIRDHDTGRILYKSDVQAYRLAESGEIRLPIEDMVFKVSWNDGRPVEKARIVVLDMETGEKFEKYTGPDGRAVLEKARHSNYKIAVYYPYTSLPVYSSETGFRGQPITVTLRGAVVSVRVLDALGSPVKGAEVSVYYMETPLGRGYTDDSGRVELTALEKPSYRVAARYGVHQAVAEAQPGKPVDVRLQVARVLGLEVSVGELSSILYISLIVVSLIVGVVVAVKLAPRILRRVGEY
ncbi:MAG: carboxypeptidase-like regulatory domain-containing protein [Thaumarchaeota archaeon]|jgi:hypothetical protein|nr:carboxypeptidase-like regulatory domain-containing protein [Candidatus Geocrenenecus arthurdayi]